MTNKRGLLAELSRRNVWRAAVLYAGVIWALSQGIAQLAPYLGVPDWAVRWFLVAAAIGFPFWVAFAWFYAWTPHGFKREEDVERDPALTRGTGRKLDFWIIGILALAVVLLLTNQFVWHQGVAPAPQAVVAQATAKPTGGPAGVVIPPPAAHIPQKSVAVLPFANLSGRKDQQYFSDGLSEDLINTLSQYQGLKVISRDSAFQFRNSNDSSAKIGRLLGVAHLLEGSVQRAGDEVRITATLVNAANGSVVWSQRYDRPYADLFKLQDAITGAVAAQLRTQLVTAPGAVLQTDRPPGGSLAAYTAYQQGNADSAQGTEAAIRRAIAAYEKAIGIDPDYTAAYAQLAQAWINLASSGLLPDQGKIAQANAKARSMIATALKLDPDSALAHSVHSTLLDAVERNWAGAEAEARRALQLAPNSAGAKYTLGTKLAALGKVHEAVKLTRQALVSNPRNANWYSWLSGYLTALDQLDDATRAANRSIALHPGSVDFHEQLAVIAILRNQPGAALAAARAEPPGAWHDIAMALALQIGPDRKAADAALQKLIARYAKGAPYQIAEVYALRKDPDATFHWLDRAWAERDPGISTLLYDPFILRYRHDPRFAAFCRKAGLPTTTDAVAMP